MCEGGRRGKGQFGIGGRVGLEHLRGDIGYLFILIAEGSIGGRNFWNVLALADV